MPNRTHWIAVPQSEESLRRAAAEALRRYARRIHVREGWRGYLWQGRFSSYVMDEAYVIVAARYIELRPVRAGLRDDPLEYPCSSAKTM